MTLLSGVTSHLHFLLCVARVKYIHIFDIVCRVVNMKYRAEIDGLRALAVVPVILFHAGFELFRGGFVGVDVFFVISGYLITTILIEDIERKRFTFTGFYKRRARRILPALLFVMLVCIPFSWVWMLPRDLQEFSQSIVSVLLFSSNVFFWRESDYFGTSAELKPLLHTWSLAVEEQYYVLFPIFLILAWRFGKSRVFWMVVVMAAASLLLSEWGWRNKPTANFYLALTRAWELFAGSLVAFFIHWKGVRKNNALAFFGLAAVVFSIFVYDESTYFPSVYALVPVVGVSLIIIFARKETYVAKLLSARLFVGIGLISYSAYLWHQPLLSIYKYRFDTDTIGISLIVVASLSLAYISWRFIEKPFRSSHAVSTMGLICTLAVGYTFLTVIGVSGSLNLGNSLVLFRDDPYGGLFSRRKVADPNQFSKDPAKDFIIWGDSFADALAYPLNDVLDKSQVGFYSYIKHSCPSLLGVFRNEPSRLGYGFAQNCFKFNENVKSAIDASEKKPRFLVLTSAYYWYSTGRNSNDESILLPIEGVDTNEAVVSSLLRTIRWAEEHNLKPVVVLSPPKFEGLEVSIRKDIGMARSVTVPIKEFSDFNNRLKLSIQHTSAFIIDPIDLLCDQNNLSCAAYSRDSREFIVWYDGSHLSEYAARIVASKISELVSNNS